VALQNTRQPQPHSAVTFGGVIAIIVLCAVFGVILVAVLAYKHQRQAKFEKVSSLWLDRLGSMQPLVARPHKQRRRRTGSDVLTDVVPHAEYKGPSVAETTSRSPNRPSPRKAQVVAETATVVTYSNSQETVSSRRRHSISERQTRQQHPSTTSSNLSNVAAARSAPPVQPCFSLSPKPRTGVSCYRSFADVLPFEATVMLRRRVEDTHSSIVRVNGAGTSEDSCTTPSHFQSLPASPTYVMSAKSGASCAYSLVPSLLFDFSAQTCRKLAVPQQ
jgi:hypothetical protein